MNIGWLVGSKHGYLWNRETLRSQEEKDVGQEDGEKNVLYDERNDRSLCYAPPTLIAAGKKSL